MTIFYGLPGVLVATGLLTVFYRRMMGDFIDGEALVRKLILVSLAWACVGWWMETQPEAPEVPSEIILPRAAPVLVDSVSALLLPGTRNLNVIRPLAKIVIAESHARRLDPMLVAAIIQVENPWLLADTASSAGAVGIMQVMPFHADGYGCTGPLDDIGTNVCLGTAIFSMYLEESLRQALLRYNGCGRTNLRCQGYPSLVMNGL